MVVAPIHLHVCSPALLHLALPCCLLQTLRCSIMRRITKLLPETYPIYKEVNEGSGLTKKGLQQKKDDCLLFFNKVLAEHLAAEFTPTQAECAPLRELDYVAREWPVCLGDHTQRQLSPFYSSAVGWLDALVLKLLVSGFRSHAFAIR